MAYYDSGAGISQDISNAENIFKEKRTNEMTADEVREYLLEVVTGTTFPIMSEHGEMRVSFEKLQELVDEGYNIVRVLNVEDLTPYNIYIEYQKYNKTNNKRNGR